MTQKELENEIENLRKRLRKANKELDELLVTDSLTVDELKQERELRKSITDLKGKIRDRKKELEEVKKKKKAKGVTIGLVSFVLACGLIASAYFNNNKKKEATSNANGNEYTITTILRPVATATPVAKPTATPAPTPIKLSRFKDVTSERDLHNRAIDIYNIQILPIVNDVYARMAEIDEILKNEKKGSKKYRALVEEKARLEGFINSLAIDEEKLIDIIRVSNGELPLSESYTPNTVNDAIQARMEIFGNMGSMAGLSKVYPTFYTALTEDGSELQKYVASYDNLYNGLAVARNNGDKEACIEYIKEIAIKLYDEWILAGLYGGYNPYNFNSEYRSLALGSSVERFASYALEYIESNNLVICVPVCLNPNTHKKENVNVISIYEAVLTGASADHKIYMSYFGDNQKVSISKVFTNELDEELEYKSQQPKLRR